MSNSMRIFLAFAIIFGHWFGWAAFTAAIFGSARDLSAPQLVYIIVMFLPFCWLSVNMAGRFLNEVRD